MTRVDDAIMENGSLGVWKKRQGDLEKAASGGNGGRSEKDQEGCFGGGSDGEIVGKIVCGG